MMNLKVLFGALVMSSLTCVPAIASTYNVALEQEITSNYAINFRAESQEQPVFVLIGGYQGSGKTSLIRRIREIYDGNVISTDAIRQTLFDMKSVDAADIANYVSSISINLTLCALSQNTNVFIDANAHGKRIKEAEALINSNFPNYSLIKLYLKASEETLRNRVKQRQSVEGCYQGTVEDLNASLKRVQLNLQDYDFIVETDHLDEDGVFDYVNELIIPCFST